MGKKGGRRSFGCWIPKDLDASLRARMFEGETNSAFLNRLLLDLRDWLDTNPEEAIALSPWCIRWNEKIHPENVSPEPLWLGEGKPTDRPAEFGPNWQVELRSNPRVLIVNGKSQINRTDLWQLKAQPKVEEFLMNRLKPNFRYRYPSPLLEGALRWACLMPIRAGWESSSEMLIWMKARGNGCLGLREVVDAAERNAARATILNWIADLAQDCKVRLGRSRGLRSVSINGTAYRTVQIAQSIDRNIIDTSVPAYVLRDLLYKCDDSVLGKVRQGNAWLPIRWRKSQVLGYLVSQDTGMVVCPTPDVQIDISALRQSDYYRKFTSLIHDLRTQRIASAEIKCRDNSSLVLVGPAK